MVSLRKEANAPLDPFRYQWLILLQSTSRYYEFQGEKFSKYDCFHVHDNIPPMSQIVALIGQLV